MYSSMVSFVHEKISEMILTKISEMKWTKMQNTSIPTFIEKVICCYFMLTELIERISSVSCYCRAIVPCLSKTLEKHNVLM